MNKMLTQDEVRETMGRIYDRVNMDDDQLVSRFYACGEQGRDEDAADLKHEILRRMGSRIY